MNPFHLPPSFSPVAMAHHRTPARFGVENQPTSDITYNASASAFKKRSRNDFEIEISQQQQINGQQQSRMFGSIGTSTSGRPAAAVSGISDAPAGIPIADDVSLFYQHGLEIDALIRLQTERMRSELEAVRKRQCRDLLSVLGRQVVKRINDKDAELARARQLNMELEQKLRETAAKSQIWFNVAKDNEAVVSNLKSALEQALLQNTASASPSAEYGECHPEQYPADDAESCCFEEPAVWRGNEVVPLPTACRACGDKEVCVLILPCRHLCLCENCVSAIDTCPVCNSTKNASLQVFLSSL